MQGRAEMEMKWLLATAGLVILLMFPLLPSGIAAPVGDGRLPGVADAMLKADFWLAKLSSPRQAVLDPAGIVAFNRAIVQALPQAVVDLDEVPLAVGRASLRQWLAADRLPRGQVEHGVEAQVAPEHDHGNRRLDVLRLVQPVDGRCAKERA